MVATIGSTVPTHKTRNNDVYIIAVRMRLAWCTQNKLDHRVQELNHDYVPFSTYRYLQIIDTYVCRRGKMRNKTESGNCWSAERQALRMGTLMVGGLDDHKVCSLNVALSG